MPVARIQVGALEPRAEYYHALEKGDLLFFPETPFEITDSERQILLRTSQAAGAHHKNIAYRPLQDRVSGFRSSDAGTGDDLRAVMRAYSQRAAACTARLLPRYAGQWRVDLASFRPQEEEGRDLPLKKRNDLLHVDAFPTRPTHGDLILRVFTNINPAKDRVWLTSDPFAALAPRYAAAAGLAGFTAEPVMRRLLRSVGFPVVSRSPYDRFMLHFHDFLKHNAEYQRNCAKYRWDFPPNSTWMVFTDIVPHAVLSGQWALEQTFIVARGSLVSPERAPAGILEAMAEKVLR